MSHLESEFSCENLLFITEYLQTKHVLSNYYPKVIDNIKSQRKRQYFFVGLPLRFDGIKNNAHDSNNNNHNNNNNNNNNNKNNKIYDINEDGDDESDNENEDAITYRQQNSISPAHSPGTIIGHVRTLSLSSFAHYSSNRHESAVSIPQSSIVNDFIISKLNQDKSQIGKGIIDAFKALYLKYIDKENAPLMINISDSIRKKLAAQLDSSYYAYVQLHNVNGNYKSNDDGGDRDDNYRRSRKLNRDRIKGLQMLEKKLHLNYTCFIEQDWQEYDNLNESESDSIEWLINNLFLTMDSAACQIGVLLRDSCRRFKHKNPQIFAKAYKKTKKYTFS